MKITHKAPSYMPKFPNIRDVHNHYTRQSVSSLFIDKSSSNGPSSFKFNGTKLWNSLPNNVTDCESYDLFKRSTKSHLMDAFCMNS